MATNSTKQVAWWQVQLAVVGIRFFLHTKSGAGTNTALPDRKRGYYAGFEEGSVFVRFYLEHEPANLYCYKSYMDEPNDIRE